MWFNDWVQHVVTSGLYSTWRPAGLKQWREQTQDLYCLITASITWKRYHEHHVYLPAKSMNMDMSLPFEQGGLYFQGTWSRKSSPSLFQAFCPMPHITIFPACSNPYSLLNLSQFSLLPISSFLLLHSFPLVPAHLSSLFPNQFLSLLLLPSQPGCLWNIHVFSSLYILELRPGACWEDKTGQVLGLPSCPLECTIICPRGSPTHMLQFQPGPHLMCMEPSEMFVLTMEMGFSEALTNYVLLVFSRIAIVTNF